MPRFGKIGSKIIQKRIQNYLNQLFIYRERILVNDTILEKMTQKREKIFLLLVLMG